MQEMRFMVGSIKDKINHHLGREYVAFIQFTLDRKSVPSVDDSDPTLRDFLAMTPGDASAVEPEDVK